MNPTVSRYDGKIQLHVLESEGLVSEERESKIFPEAGRTDVISCIALTPDFLIWGTDMGGLNYFYIEDWAVITEFKHITGQKFAVNILFIKIYLNTILVFLCDLIRLNETNAKISYQ